MLIINCIQIKLIAFCRTNSNFVKIIGSISRNAKRLIQKFDSLENLVKKQVENKILTQKNHLKVLGIIKVILIGLRYIILDLLLFFYVLTNYIAKQILFK